MNYTYACKATYPPKDSEYIRRSDGLRAWITFSQDGWSAFVEGRKVASRATWDEAVQAAQRQIGRVLR